MSEICEKCGKQYTPNSDTVKIFQSCSERCRAALNWRRANTKKIEEGNFDSFKVSKIKDLGFNVIVSKEREIKNELNCDVCIWTRNTIQKRKKEIKQLENNLHAHTDGDHFE